jgi:hypothetical protein
VIYPHILFTASQEAAEGVNMSGASYNVPPFSALLIPFSLVATIRDIPLY